MVVAERQHNVVAVNSRGHYGGTAHENLVFADFVIGDNVVAFVVDEDIVAVAAGHGIFAFAAANE